MAQALKYRYNDRLCLVQTHPEPPCEKTKAQLDPTYMHQQPAYKIRSLSSCKKTSVKHVSRESQTTNPSSVFLFVFFGLLEKKDTLRWVMYRYVITQHVCTALTNFLLDWAAKTPAPQSTSWCDRPIFKQDYPGLQSLCFVALSFPAVLNELQHMLPARRGVIAQKKTSAVKTARQSAACQRTTRPFTGVSVSSWSYVNGEVSNGMNINTDKLRGNRLYWLF